MDKQNAIEISNICFAYSKNLILEEINVSIKERDFVSIIGPNGGGKTTLLKLILGLLKPSNGKIKIFGETPERGRKQIGYVPQYMKFDPRFPITVKDVVLMGRLGKNKRIELFNEEDLQIARESLELVNLAHMEDMPFYSLSGGQRQRALIARALTSKPKILLLDEPTANLDTEVGSKFYDLLKELNKELTIVLVSHDVGFVSKFVSRIICLNKNVVEHPATDTQCDIFGRVGGADFQMVMHNHHLEKKQGTCND